ncbi:S1C family serine protease [Aquibacillus sp. 3ASR75-11]|uniref:S1C family serine protease n=1 Tax=Terrihalobacillus insolitus TaxID=2950438 RepID=A0A9X3WTT8_9BACI|nr:trypsin-like peptidase domain-containing protein [Terrihalobacillus insolitus]MDC3412742.1 S1C family serine protease [Terrihalobacillus insolitus]MDC3423781.1 S1C family serine protease [Terrihalobacillus insolitus]
MTKKKKVFPILLTCFLLLLGALSVSKLYEKWNKDSLSVKNTLATKVKVDDNENKDLKTIIHEAQKGVVQIEAAGEESDMIGSGFLYNEKGDIITNAHVVKDANAIYVKTTNASTYPAAVVGIGKETDIAVIRVPQLANQSPMQLEQNIVTDVGDEIIAVGSPLGFQNSVTLGIISGMNRSFSIDDFSYTNVFQISANITNGNSGGPLINRDSGKVIGINSAGAEEGTIGFSIPIKNIIDQVTEWSKTADEDTLEYATLENEVKEIDQEQLKEDATYLIQYFFSSLEVRDYVNAYALLGSDWQSQTTYQEFRESFVRVVTTTITNIDITLVEEQQFMVKVNADSTIRQSDQTTQKVTSTFAFEVGYENDQLKILNSEQSPLNLEDQVDPNN